jgi:histidinol phosphatase-like PHP family hydrolase
MSSLYKQDLHIHTVYSTHDGAVVPEQTLDLVESVRHADVIGISDHFQYIDGKAFDAYSKDVLSRGFKLGTEVGGGDEAADAVDYPFDYFIYHCRNKKKHYRGLDTLLSTGKPVIVAHPLQLGTDFSKLSDGCLVEINNRYIWRHDWRRHLTPVLGRFRFLLNSDAHQPNWLNLNVSRMVASKMAIEETILF